MKNVFAYIYSFRIHIYTMFKLIILGRSLRCKIYFIKRSIVLSLVKHPVDKAIQKQVHEPQNSACSEIRGQRYGEKV